MTKQLIFIFFVGLVPLFVLAQNSHAQLQTEVMMKMMMLRNSLLKKDSVALSNLLADDVTYGHTNGLMQTKAQIIRSVVSGEQDYKTIEPSDMNVRIYGTTGVVTMKSKVTMLFKGSPLDMAMFVTLVWARDDKDWKLVARQSVKQ